jgi:SAM-dependent methyltransferase
MIHEKFGNYDTFLQEINRVNNLPQTELSKPETQDSLATMLLNNQEHIVQHQSDPALFEVLKQLIGRISQLSPSEGQNKLVSDINRLGPVLKLQMKPQNIPTDLVKPLESSVLGSASFKAALKENSISNMSPEKIREFGTEEYVTIRTLKTELPEGALGRYNYSGSSYLESFGRIIGKRLIGDLEKLQPQDIYLDIGCGEGAAIKEYRASYPDGAAVVGISLTRPSEENLAQVVQKDQNDEKFAYCLDDFNKFPAEALKGKASIITDVFGAFRYGQDPTRYIEQVGKLLKPGGKVYIRFLLNDGIEVPKEGKFNASYLGERKDSSDVMRLWFHTIRGFDVIQPEMTQEESRKYHEWCFKEAPDLYKIGSKQKESGGPQVILQRNADPVQVDQLTAHPRFATPKAESEKNYEMWYPSYEWKMSDYSKELIGNKPMILFE